MHNVLKWGYNVDVPLNWENEDELPDMPDEVYNAMYPLSEVDFVRYFPYIIINNKRAYLISLGDE
jgi:hypothetical protein